MLAPSRKAIAEESAEGAVCVGGRAEKVSKLHGDHDQLYRPSGTD